VKRLVLGAAVLLAGCGSTPTAAPPASGPASAVASASAKPSGNALNIAYVAPADSFLWEVTSHKQGLFQKYGVAVNEPVFVGGTPRLGQALVGGSFELAGVGFAAATEANAAGADLEAVAAISKYSGFSLLLPPGSPIKDPKELKGKTIVLSQIGDTADGFLTTLLEKNGLNRNSDVKVTQRAPPRTLACSCSPSKPTPLPSATPRRSSARRPAASSWPTPASSASCSRKARCWCASPGRIPIGRRCSASSRR